MAVFALNVSAPLLERAAPEYIVGHDIWPPRLKKTPDTDGYGVLFCANEMECRCAACFAIAVFIFVLTRFVPKINLVLDNFHLKNILSYGRNPFIQDFTFRPYAYGVVHEFSIASWKDQSG